MTINLKNFLNDKRRMSKMGEFQELKQIEGLEVSSVSADLYNNGRDDLALFYFKEGANYALLNTSNSIVSETIKWNRKSNRNFIKALMVNTQNANTFTGKQGFDSLDLMAKNLSKSLTIRESKSESGVEEAIKMKDILFASTGVIGEKFPINKISQTIQPLVDKLKEEQNKFIWLKSASAIMTTDTRPKLAYEEFNVGNKIIKIAGIAKGSGMIAPNLATMLSFIFTNVDIQPNILRTLLKNSVANSFNAITVDSDTSTNDMVGIFATKKISIGKNRTITDPIIEKFQLALKKLMLNLAKQIVVDGEGASKFITVKVINAKSTISAKKIAFSVANSPLVKTAVAGEDPNWGRVLMGVGKSGEKVEIEKLSLKLGELMVAEHGEISQDYDEERLKEYMKWGSIVIELNLNSGNSSFECYTCDFTHDYININTTYKS